jgi:transposase, IS30 family
MRSYHQLTQGQRYQISALQSLGHSYTEIAQVIRVHKSTISREIARNSSVRSYQPLPAQQKALHRRRPPVYRISAEVWEHVYRLLQQDWSPEQISGRLKREHQIRLSPEWIYQYVFANRRLGGTLFQHLRQLRKRKKRGRASGRQGRLPNIISIDLRPAIVNRRSRLGDWEVDTLLGQRAGNVLVTLTERKSRLTLLAIADRQSSAAVRRQICRLLLPYQEKVFSLTSDNGKEFSEHEEIARTLGVSFYFAHPYSAWERGTNENTNGLLRQYFPKHASLQGISETQVEAVMHKLNDRPRKTLGFRTPFEVFFHQSVALVT